MKSTNAAFVRVLLEWGGGSSHKGRGGSYYEERCSSPSDCGAKYMVSKLNLFPPRLLRAHAGVGRLPTQCSPPRAA